MVLPCLMPVLGRRQVYSNAATLSHLARFSRVFRALRSYRRVLMAEAHEKGYPLVRPLFWHYPEDPQCTDLNTQVRRPLLGERRLGKGYVGII
jgi:alpha-glucosidase (family GH31 glycosyl hydrolase)